MPKKFEIVGQALVITDESIPKVLFDAPKGEVYYDSDLLINEGIIKINNLDTLDNATKSAPRVLLSDAIDGSDTSFTESSFILFARQNLGFKTASGGSGAVDSVFGRTGAVIAQSGDYSKSQVGLGNVDNTSDSSKPVSTATQSALDSKLNNSQLIDDDTFATATSANIPSAESVKAYVDANAGGGASVSDDAYNEITWNGATTIAPSKNAVRDKIESLVLGVGTGATPIKQTFVGGETSWNTGVTITPSHMFLYGDGTGTLIPLDRDVDYTYAGTTITFTGILPIAAGDVLEYHPLVAVPTTYDASETTVDASGFGGNLSPTDTDVQTALETIDALVLGGGTPSTTLEETLTITNPVITGGIATYEIVPAQGAGKIIMIESFNAFSVGGSAATGNTSITGRYSGLGGNSLTNSVIMAAAGTIYTINGGGSTVSTTGDLTNRAFNIVVNNTTDQSLTVTIFVKIRYVIGDTTTGF